MKGVTLEASLNVMIEIDHCIKNQLKVGLSVVRIGPIQHLTQERRTLEVQKIMYGAYFSSKSFFWIT